MKTYAGIEETYALEKNAAIRLLSIPYDGTSTWGKGADEGFTAFLNASENMELYDIETKSEVYKKGVFIDESLSSFTSPKQMFTSVYSYYKSLIKTPQFLTTFGGEHSISIGIIKAFYEAFPNLSVLQFDAHADLRPSYLGSPYNHACAVFDASQHCNLVQVGIRSMDIEECQYTQSGNFFPMVDIRANQNWKEEVINQLTDTVYLTIDLDGFDPSVCPGTGTPEPGGFFWSESLQFFKMLFSQKNVISFDIVELAPIPNQLVSQFMAAKLYYKLLSYKFCL